MEAQYADSFELRELWRKQGTIGEDLMNGITLANYKEEGFSGDAASLFTLVKFKKDGLEKVELVKLGWREFSKNVFKKGAKSLYSDSIPERRGEKTFTTKPYMIYCVACLLMFTASVSTTATLLIKARKKTCFFILKNISKNTLNLSQKAVKL